MSTPADPPAPEPAASAAPAPADPAAPAQAPEPAAPADERKGAFLDGAVITGGTVVGVAEHLEMADPDAPYDVRGIANPYLGLRSFTYDDRGKYAGRERLVAETVAAMTAPGEQRGLIFVTGASGSGKSSFAQAGLIPAIEAFYQARSTTTRRAVARPSRRPISQLADALAQLGLASALADLPDAESISALIAAKTPEGQVNLVVLDQFEELFTQADPGERERFFAWVEHLPPFSATRTHLIATMRSDYLPELFQREPLYTVAKQGVDLRAMTAAELSAAIRRPLEQARPQGDRHFEDALLARLAQDAAGDSAYLPLLQITLEDIWSRGMLKLSAYGSITDAIRARAERVYAYGDYDGAGASPRPKEEQTAIEEIFLDLVEVSLDDGVRADVRQRRTYEELTHQGASRAALVDDLVAARLLTRGVETRGDAQVAVVDIVHETLIANWGQLRGWIDSRREALQQRERFEQAMDEWAAGGQRDEYLLEGVWLAEAEALARRGDVALRDERARAFLEQSVRRREAARRAQLRRARIVAAGLGALALVALVAAGLAIQQVGVRAEAQRRLREQLVVADSQRLAAVAQTLPATSAETKLLLAMEAFGYQRNALTEQALRDALSQIAWRSFPLVGHQKWVQTARFSADGQRVVTASGDGTARLWDLSGRMVATISGPGGTIYDASLSPDGQRVLISCADGTARVLDIGGRELLALRGHTGIVYNAIFSPDGTRIVTVSADQTGAVWDLAGRRLAVLKGHTSSVGNVSFSPDGSKVVTASDDGTARVWDLEGRQLAVLKGHDGKVYSAAFSPDGTRIATASADKTARLWSADGTPIRQIGFHLDEVNDVTFNADGQRIVTASGDNVVRVWDTDGNLLGFLSGHTGSVGTASYSPDGGWLVTASDDGTARLWQLDGLELSTIFGHQDQLRSAAYSPDGKQIVTTSFDGTARVWDTAGHQLLRIQPNEDYHVHDAAFSPDGTKIATASTDSIARVWDTGGKLLAELKGHGDWVNSVEFSRDGQRILTASADGTARVWDLSGRQLAVIQPQAGPLSGASFSPDGTKIATASDDGVARVWDTGGKLLAELRGHTSYVYSARFSPDGATIVTASGDKTARVWDLSGRQLAVLRGHEGAVFDAGFSPDGTKIVTGSYDGTAQVWDTGGRQLFVLRGPINWVRSARFSPDGTRVVVASLDTSARQYAVSADDTLAVAACRVGRGLTADEIERYGVPTPLSFDFARRTCPPALSWEK